MSWDTQLDSILTATEHNMAKIKERLYRKGELSKDQHLDLLYDNIMPYEEAPSKPDVPCASSVTSMSRVGTSEDIVSISSQLLSQAKMLTSLHQAISKLERDRDHQQQRIQSLEDEVRQLRALQGDKQDSALERKVEGLRHELSRELRHLQERARDSPVREIISGQHSSASIMQEVNESKRLLWKEYESLRRDTDYLHQRLRRQEDDVLRQFAESQEVKQVQGRNTKMLEGLQSSQQTQTLELNRTKSETREIQRDLLQIRSAIGDLKEEVKTLEEKLYTCSVKNDRKERGKPSTTRKKGTKSSSPPSSEEDTDSQISLADISSEDTSYSLNVPTPSHGSRERSSASHRPRVTDQRSSSRLDDFSDDLDGLSDSPPELNFSDL